MSEEGREWTIVCDDPTTVVAEIALRRSGELLQGSSARQPSTLSHEDARDSSAELKDEEPTASGMGSGVQGLAPQPSTVVESDVTARQPNTTKSHSSQEGTPMWKKIQLTCQAVYHSARDQILGPYPNAVLITA